MHEVAVPASFQDEALKVWWYWSKHAGVLENKSCQNIDTNKI